MPPDRLGTVRWTAEMSVGIPSFDQQHRKIIDTFNRLLAANDARVDSEIMSETLTELTRFASEHFRDEEHLLEEVGYPGIEEQKEHHRQFREKIVQCCLATTIGVGVVPGELLSYIHDWLIHHVLEQDLQYKPFLAAYKSK